MKQVLVELTEEMMERLERVAPGRKRMRAAFIRDAIQRALDAEEESRTEAAYRRVPQGEGTEWFDPAVWDGGKKPTGRRAR